MATTLNKQRILNQLLAVPDLVPPAPAENATEEPLPVLEQFIFALCRENATPEQAQAAFHNLRTKFFDWNEVRVSSVRELEEAMAGLSDAERRAQRVLSFLQEVFETTFSFNLDSLAKKGQKQAAKALTRFKAANDYASAWVVQRTLSGHAIPLDETMLRCARRLGLLDGTTEDLEAARASLEHVVQKAKGTAFTDAMANLAELHCWEDEPKCSGCPMSGDCPSSQEDSQQVSLTLTRTKPR